MTPFLVKLLQFVLRAAHLTSLSLARAQAENTAPRGPDAAIAALAGWRACLDFISYYMYYAYILLLIRIFSLISKLYLRGNTIVYMKTCIEN